jgi:hypothetical protein
MSTSIKSALKSLLQGVSWLLFAIAGLSFWVGGRAISEFAKMDRLLSEVAGLGLAGVCGALGFVAKTTGERLAEAEEDEASSSEGEYLRK